uniref:Adhesion G protein-coupled receptor A1 n=1 Tax=Rousettus aegyptiacus TaxID=9407 RepID=A0A7J8G3F5_ROUAE|nr:adhesion G protein-coupled receptor A1 [Rousettus aegyptiacus]
MWFVLAVWGEVPWLMVMSSTPRISVTTRLGPDASSFARSPRFHLPICRRRFYLISGGVPFIICGVTAATNIRNYGTEDEDSA